MLGEESKDLSKQRDVPYLWMGRLRVVKVSTLPKELYRFNVLPIKVPGGFCLDRNKPFLRLDRNAKGPK